MKVAQSRMGSLAWSLAILLAWGEMRPVLGQTGGLPSVYFATASQTVSEEGMAGKPVKVKVKLSAPSSDPVKVWCEVKDGLASVSGKDYEVTSKGTKFAVDFLPEQTEVEIEPALILDDLAQDTWEYFIVTLTEPVNAVVGDPGTHYVYIADTDNLPWGITVAADRPAVCAGGRATAPHQATITASLTDPSTGMPVAVSGVTVTFTTTSGSLSANSAVTDENGRALITLTSGNLASEGAVQVHATVTAQVEPNSASTKVEFQAPQALLAASPPALVQGESSELLLTLKWNEYPVEKHGLAWSVAKVWNAEGELAYDGVGEYPGGYGSFDARADETATGGYGTATFRGTAPGKVQLLSMDVDVVFVASGDKPKAVIEVATTGEGGLAQIYSGSSGDGGKQDGKKVSDDAIGAFTVANLNDTDGDGTVDKDDPIVKGTKKGRDEVDLMRLVLVPQKPDGANKITVTVVKGKVKFWNHSHKEKEIDVTLNAFTPGGGHLWVEATDPSAELRDIEIKVEYKGVAKTVRATAVWATMTAAAHDTKSADDLFKADDWKDMPSPPKDRVLLFGGTGLRPPAKTGVRNLIAIQFTVYPKGVGKEVGVSFDLTRQAEAKSWDKTGDKVSKGLDDPPLSSLAVEEANDDPHPAIDESNIPDEKDRLYVEDPPGPPSEVANDDVFVMRMNAREFVRVRFDGKDHVGDGMSGSRCSSYYDWHVRHHLTKNVKTGNWERSTGDKEESIENDIGDTPTPHIEIGTFK